MKVWLTFFSKVLLGTVLLFAADRVTGYFMRKLYFSQIAGPYYDANYAFDSTTSSGLILGSSRAYHHYVPTILQNQLKKDFYNSGRDGTGVLYHKALFDAALRRYTPNLIIMDVWPKYFYNDEKNYDKLSALLPYYRNHPEIGDIINLKSPYEKYKLFSQTYPFNSQLASLIAGKFGLFQTNKFSKKGYSPLFGTMKAGRANNLIKEPESEVDSIQIEALNEIASTCRQKNIQLVFICSPVYSNPKYLKANEQINNLAERYQVPYWNFSGDSTFDNHPEYFNENGHLNDEGAVFFSNIIGKKIVTDIYKSR